MIKLERIGDPYYVGECKLVMAHLTIGEFKLCGEDSQPELVFTVEAFEELKAALEAANTYWLRTWAKKLRFGTFIQP